MKKKNLFNRWRVTLLSLYSYNNIVILVKKFIFY